MEHKFSDNYTENALPVEAKGSFVRPIPKEENIMPRPVASAYSRSNAEILSMMPESYSVPAEEGLINTTTLAVAENMKFPTRATLIAQPEEGLEEETVNTLPGTTTITEKQPDVELAEDSCFMNNDMDTRGKPAEPKGPPLVREKRRNSSLLRKRADGKKWKCNYTLILLIFNCC